MRVSKFSFCDKYDELSWTEEQSFGCEFLAEVYSVGYEIFRTCKWISSETLRPVFLCHLETTTYKCDNMKWNYHIVVRYQNSWFALFGKGCQFIAHMWTSSALKDYKSGSTVFIENTKKNQIVNLLKCRRIKIHVNSYKDFHMITSRWLIRW